MTFARLVYRRRVISIILLMALLPLITLVFSFSDSKGPKSVKAAEACQTFQETGFSVCGKFLDYWNTHGGLAQQGFPISEVIDEQSSAPPVGDGKTYKVQYFERARFELHPENKAPYDVLLGLLGSDAYKTKYLAKQSGVKFLTIMNKQNVTKLDPATPKGTPDVPQSGNTFLIVDFLVTDNTGKILTANPSFLTLKDADNYAYKMSALTSRLIRSLKTVRLDLNEAVRGEVLFEVPQDANITSVSFDDNTNKVTIPFS